MRLLPPLTRPREFTLNRNSMQARGLVCWIPDMEGVGDRSQDFAHARRNPVIWTDEPLIVGDPLVGLARSFDGVADYGIITRTNDFNFGTGDFSISLWFNSTSVTTSFYIPVGKDTGAIRDWAIIIGLTASRISWFNYIALTETANNTDLSADTWYHGAFVRTGDNINIYINGLADGSAMDTSDHNKTNDIWIGRREEGSVPAKYPGKITNLMFHNRALTPAEVWQQWAPQTRWELYQPVKRRARVFVSAVQTLSPDFITSGAVVFNPTLSPGVVELSPDFIASTAQSFNPEIIHAPQDIELTFIATGAQVFDPTLVPGAMELNPGFISSASQSFNTDLQYGQNVEPGLITSGAQTFNVEIHTEQDLEPGFIATGTVVFNPTLEVGALSILPGFIASTAQAFNVEPSQGAAQYVIEATVDNDAGTVTVEIFNFNTSVTNQLRRWYTDEGPGSAIMIRLAVAEDGTFVDCNVQSHREVNYQGIESGSGLVSATVTATQELAQLFVHQVTRHVTTTNAVIGPVSLISPRPQIDGHTRETGAFRLAEDAQVTHVPSEIDRRVFRQLVKILASERSKIWDLQDIVDAMGTVCVRTPGLGGEPGIIIFGTMRRWPPSEDGFISDYQIEVEQTSFKEAIS